MTKLTAVCVMVLALGLTGPADAQGWKVTDGPDIQHLPEATIPSPELSKEEKRILTEIGKLDPRLRRNIEAKLKETKSSRERYRYLVKKMIKHDRRIDVAERNYKLGRLDKKQLVSLIKTGKKLGVLLSDEEVRYTELLRLEEKPGSREVENRYNEKNSQFWRAYRPFRSARRKRMELHKKVGMTQPPKKKADDKPKTPASGDDKKACSGGGMMGTMNCVETLIEQEG